MFSNNDLDKACRLLDRMAAEEPRSRTVKETLTQLAELTLCPRWHRKPGYSQVESVAEMWWSRINFAYPQVAPTRRSNAVGRFVRQEVIETVTSRAPNSRSADRTVPVLAMLTPPPSPPPAQIRSSPRPAGLITAPALPSPPVQRPLPPTPREVQRHERSAAPSPSPQVSPTASAYGLARLSLQAAAPVIAPALPSPPVQRQLPPTPPEVQRHEGSAAPSPSTHTNPSSPAPPAPAPAHASHLDGQIARLQADLNALQATLSALITSSPSSPAPRTSVESPAPSPVQPSTPVSESSRPACRNHTLRKSITDGCPICFDPICCPDDAVWCRGQCGQNLHRDCFRQWMEHINGENDARREQDEEGEARPITCPCCRAGWKWEWE